MNLAGKLNINGTELLLYLHDLQDSETFILMSKYHIDDRFKVAMGEEPKHTVLNLLFDTKKNYSMDYVIEAITRRKKTGVVTKYGNEELLEGLIDVIGYARSYRFTQENIQTKENEIIDGKRHESFGAADSEVQFNYEMVNGCYSYLRVNAKGTLIDLAQVGYVLSVPTNLMEEVQKYQQKRILISSIKNIDYDALCNVLDMSWYKDESGLHKDYRAIKSNEEFELKIMREIAKALEKCIAQGKQLDIAVDTETSGLNVYNLAPDNPDKDHCVAIPICWEVNHSNVIFTDMEHFTNADNQYVTKRLAELFEKFDGKRTLEYYDYADDSDTDMSDGHTRTTKEHLDNATTGEMNAFSKVEHSTSDFDDVVEQLNDFESSIESAESSDCEETSKCPKLVKRTITFKRDDINLIGHNSGFDARVFYDIGPVFYFDQDTLQMAFDINPQSVRGNKKLKVLTRYFFNAETPELTDILGKNNEDKYRYLVDEEAARIYGCADADFTLAIFYELRKLMSDRMYYWYQQQDIPLINILSRSEYYGMQCIPEEVKKLAEETRDNIEILKNTMYQYIGIYVKFQNDLSLIEAKNKAGQFQTEEEYHKALDGIQVDQDAIYKFEFKPAQLKHVIYDIMKYPIFAYTDGKNGKEKQPKLDKYVIKKLLSHKLSPEDKPPRKLQKDILISTANQEEYKQLREIERLKSEKKAGKKAGKKADSMVLISAKEFNKLKYPLALILQKYSDLNKEYTSYYAPMETQNLEGKIFKGYNMARIETRRISNPGQTMKGKLKALIRSYSDDYYILDFDMSQIEYRLMLSLSHFHSAILKMDNPESDYHTETASMIENIPAHRVTKKQRKSAKSTSFGVPYGLGDGSMCENLFGDRTPDHMIMTRKVLKKWKKANYPIMKLLEDARAQALTEWVIDDRLRDFMGMWKRDDDGNFIVDESGHKVPIPISRVENMLGFYRVFSLENIDLSDEAKKRRASGEFTPEEADIRRKAGNYPIQSAAAEIFRIILRRFYESCVEHNIANKVIWHMLIHDELLCSVKKDVHPFLLYDIVKNACMITMKGHTKYYVGINIGDTWAEAKDDSREAPIYFVNRMIARYRAGEFPEKVFDHPWDFIKPYREQYVQDRIGEVLHEIQPNFPDEPLDCQCVLDEFKNYTVRAYVNDYPINGTVDLIKDDADPDSVNKYYNCEWLHRLESWALAVYGDGVRFKGIDDKVYAVHEIKEPDEPDDNDAIDFVDYDRMFEKDDFADSFDEEDDDNSYLWDDNTDSVYQTAFSESVDVSNVRYKDEELQYDFSRKAKDVNELVVVKHTYDNIKTFNEQVVITLKHQTSIDILTRILSSDIVDIGNRVVFQCPGMLKRWEKIRMNYDLHTLDAIVDLLNNGINEYTEINNIIFAPVNTTKGLDGLKRALSEYPGEDHVVYFINNNKIIASSQFSNIVSTKKFKKIITNWR